MSDLLDGADAHVKSQADIAKQEGRTEVRDVADAKYRKVLDSVQKWYYGHYRGTLSPIHMEDSWSTVLRDDMGRPCVVLCAVWVVLMW